MLRAFDIKSNQKNHPPPGNNPYDYKFNTTTPNLVNRIFHPKTDKIMAYRKLINDPTTQQT